ncbi:MAG TPA: cytochrome b/b6 domain-containing protein [Alphaproteobacteria bacterium]|nr:cytochrome b/b6 domain-containing protein [Alphaproteobacteria bacterium]
MHGEPGAWIYVWDPFVRVFHWALVAGFAVAYLTGDEVLGIHVWTGYAIGVLIVTRLIWGFIGPRHARFADFVSGPATTFRYLRDLLFFRAKRHIGHSPAGGVMIILLFLTLSATVGSGLIVYAAEEDAGPLAGMFVTPAATQSVGRGDVEDEKEGLERNGFAESDIGEPAKEVHEFFANLTLLLVILHVGAVVFMSFAHRENLVRAMVTGFKRR